MENICNIFLSQNNLLPQAKELITFLPYQVDYTEQMHYEFSNQASEQVLMNCMCSANFQKKLV